MQSSLARKLLSTFSSDRDDDDVHFWDVLIRQTSAQHYPLPMGIP